MTIVCNRSHTGPVPTSRALFLSLLFLLSSACDESSTPDAATPLDAAPLTCGALAAFDVGPPDGATSPLASVGPDAARAGRVSEADLPVDPEGLGTWRDGDLVLANDRVAILISDPASPCEVYDPYGGRIVGITRVEGGALVEPADYSVLMLGLGRFLIATDAVGVENDGSDGGPAVIRARGPLAPIRALADLLDGLLPDDFEGLPAALEYELAPGSDHVDVTLSVRAGDRGVRARLGIVQVFFQGFRMPPWAPGDGFAERTDAPRYLAFADDRATSYAWMAPEGTLAPLFATGGIDLFTSTRVNLEPCEEARIPVGRLVIGGRGLPGVQAAVAALEGTATRAVRGLVVEADGTPAPDARVHVTTGDGEHLTRVWPEADGSFEVEVEERAAQLWAYREGAALVGPIAIGATDARIEMSPSAILDVTVTDVDSGALPARVEVTPVDGSIPTPPASFGEQVVGWGRTHVAYPTDGHAVLRVAPGSHRVRVTRGPEYELVERTVDVAAGATGAETVMLSHVVDTTGVMCADYHIHSHRSVDSADPGALKVAGLVADGLEIAIRSEHEWVSDYQPLIEELGLSRFAFGMAGLELTTFTYGHFGVFPLVPDDRPSGGAVVWYDRLAPDVFDEVRSRPEAPALIINHPRAGGARQGYFAMAGYDPATGSLARPELWDDEFTVVEVFNDSDFERNRDGTVRDWFSLLNSGRRVFAVGSSDSHEIRTVPVGYPRTCLRLGVDEASELTADAIRAATVAGHAVVSGGIYLDVIGPGGAGPGDEASGVGASAPFEVVVRAASWVDVDRLEVFVDGESVEVMPIVPDDADLIEPTIRARAAIDVDVSATGSWVVFYAGGTEELLTVRQRPYAVSNPVFLTR